MDKETKEYSINTSVELRDILTSEGYQVFCIEPDDESDIYKIIMVVEDLFDVEHGGIVIGILPLIIKGKNYLMLNCISTVSELIKEETRQEIEHFVKLQNQILTIGNIFIANERVCLKYADIELIDYIDEERFLTMVELVIHQARIMSKKTELVINAVLSVEEVLTLDVLKGG